MGRRWRRRRYAAQHRWTHAQPASASERARAFVLREFFDLDGMALARVIQLYGREYGHGRRKYFESTFEKWRSGDVQPRRETQDRILHCVPRFLPPAKQFTILGFYIPEYLSHLVAASRVHNLAMEAVPSAFADAARRCRETDPKLDWFVRGVFSDAEIAAFADVARYTVLDRLHRSYGAVRLDLATATHHLAGVDAKIVMRYRLDELGGLIELNGVVPTLPATAFDMPSVPELVVRHREEYERLLLDHHCEMIVEQEAQVARHSVARLDLSILENAIASVSKAESLETSFEARGAGGTFEGTVSRKNLPALKAQLFGRIVVATLCTLGIVAGIAAAFTSKDLRGFAVCGFWIVLAAVPALWSWVIEKHREVRDYERGQSTRFAKVRR